MPKTRPPKEKAVQNFRDSTPPPVALAPPLVSAPTSEPEERDVIRELFALLEEGGFNVRMCECAPCHIWRANAPCPCSKCHLPRMLVFSDAQRHLVCWPNSDEHLQVMADFFRLKRGWFHAGGGRGKNRKGRHPHYDIPKKRFAEIRAKTIDATPREVLSISKGELPERFVQMWRENIWARAEAVK